MKTTHILILLLLIMSCSNYDDSLLTIPKKPISQDSIQASLDHVLGSFLCFRMSKCKVWDSSNVIISQIVNEKLQLKCFVHSDSLFITVQGILKPVSSNPIADSIIIPPQIISGFSVTGNAIIFEGCLHLTLYSFVGVVEYIGNK
jgi:hypothetical protein